MDSGRFLKVPGQAETEMDKYTASIELSNACRQFYQARLEAAHCYKSRWERHANSNSSSCCEGSNNGNNNGSNFNKKHLKSSEDQSCSTTSSHQHRKRNSIDEAMDRLRSEMTSLMDQDLSLMKQLLTLNETIEELKWQRRYYYSYSHDSSQGGSLLQASFSSANALHGHSNGSLSDAEMYAEEESEADEPVRNVRAPGTSSSHNSASSSTSASISASTPLVVVFTPPQSSPSTASHHHHRKQQGGSRVTAVEAHASRCASCRVTAVVEKEAKEHASSRCALASGAELRKGVKTSGMTKASEAAAVKVEMASVEATSSSSKAVKVYLHGEQDSFDSGFHEQSSEEEVAVSC